MKQLLSDVEQAVQLNYYFCVCICLSCLVRQLCGAPVKRIYLSFSGSRFLNVIFNNLEL